MSTSNKISIGSLDHVALRVKNLTISVDWYERVLGLKKYQLAEWGDYPIFLLSGKSRNVKFDHFAFNVTNENFEKAKKWYEELKLEFNIQDHHYFHSIYTKDPDGHTVELTTIVVNENEFY
jgi:catechol 2,3-dioxygenase-like lactoylglutathione lyase family enzyme